MAFKGKHVYNYLEIYIFDMNMMLGVDLHGCVYRVKLVALGMFR